MYRIVKETDTLATVTALSWVRLQDNGCYALCDEDIAQGIVVDGTVYHVAGKPDLTGAETVAIGEISEATYQKEQAAAQAETQLQMETALAELSILIANAFTTTAQ